MAVDYSKFPDDWEGPVTHQTHTHPGWPMPELGQCMRSSAGTLYLIVGVRPVQSRDGVARSRLTVHRITDRHAAYDPERTFDFHWERSARKKRGLR